MSKTVEQKYSRSEIADQEKRSKAIEGIRADNKGVNKTKSAEGKKELSQAWINKANLSPEQKKAVCDELLVKDIDNETPEELERRVKALQKHLGFANKDCDGILGWKTLEKVDKMIEDQHNLEDEESGEKKSDKLGLARIGEEEDGERQEKQEKIAQTQEEDKTRQLDEIVANGTVDAELASTYGIDENTAQEYLQKKIVTQEEEKFQNILTKKPELKKIFGTLSIFADSPARGYIENTIQTLKKRAKQGDITIKDQWDKQIHQDCVKQVARSVLFPDKPFRQLNPTESAQLNSKMADINRYITTSTKPSYAELIAKIQTTPEPVAAINYQQDTTLSKTV